MTHKIIPAGERLDDAFADKLYELSEALAKKNPEAQHHGLMGGQYGYGQEYQNDLFIMRPYYWGDCTCGHDEEEERAVTTLSSKDYHDWVMQHTHVKDCALELPNFHYLPTNLQIVWYKYIGRSMQANQNLSIREFNNMIHQCLKSVRSEKHVPN